MSKWVIECALETRTISNLLFCRKVNITFQVFIQISISKSTKCIILCLLAPCYFEMLMSAPVHAFRVCVWVCERERDCIHVVCLVYIALLLIGCHFQLSFNASAHICHTYSTKLMKRTPLSLSHTYTYTYTHTQSFGLFCIYLDVLRRWVPLNSLLFIYLVLDSATSQAITPIYLTHTHTRTQDFHHCSYLWKGHDPRRLH